MRLMVAGIFDGLALLVVIGLISPQVHSGRLANIVANVVLVPAAIFERRPGRPGPLPGLGGPCGTRDGNATAPLGRAPNGT